MDIRRLLITSALPVAVLSMPYVTFAQTEVSDARTTNVATSTAGTGDTESDVTITSSGSVTVETGAAVTLDSDNALINDGTVSTNDSDDTTGILITGGNTGSFLNSGIIRLDETAQTDGITPTGNIAQGSGRVGILISGASPFTGNVENGATGSITIAGQDSAGIRLANSSSLVGDILNSGRMSIFGERSVGIDIAGNVIGNLAVTGNIAVTGEDAQAINVSGDISGGISVASNIAAAAYVTSSGTTITTRLPLASREVFLETTNIRQVGSAIEISGNVGNGLHIAQQLNDDGNVISNGSVNMTGSAPAILIDGNGTPIALGVVALITDTADENYDSDLQFAFVNHGSLISNGVLDDIDATAFSLADATLENGINNLGTMRATVYRSGIATDATAATHDSHARVIVIGGGGIAEQINNAGIIQAIGIEAVDSVYADPDAVLAANSIFVTAIDILAGGSTSSITNIGTISAIITGRNGEAVAIRDTSGTLTEVNNSGVLRAQAVSSDLTEEQTTNFNLIAIDVSANTTGFTFNQTAIVDPTENQIATPITSGDILLGSGDDVVNIAAGTLIGDVSFGDGADRLELSGSSSLSGSVTDSDGQLDIIVTNGSHLDITGPEDINVSSLTVDGTSIYTPFIDPSTGDTSILVASGDVTFEDGAVIAPRLATVLSDATTSFTIAQAGTLNINTSLGTLRSDQTPFLYNTVFERSATDPNTLVMTLDLRSTEELGLDLQQAAAFISAFEALQNSDTLGGAFVNITEQSDFYSAYNQLLPEFAASSRQFILANVDGAVGAVGAHLNTARHSHDTRPGGLWIEEFAYFADRSLAGLSEQFRGYGFGVTGGFDTSFGPFHTAGINIGFATTEIEDVLGIDEPLDVLTLQAGVYAGYKTGNLGVDMYVGGGYNDFEANRKVVIGDFSETAHADWSGTHINGSVSAGYDISFGRYFARPAGTLTYLSLNEKAYNETGDTSIALALDKRSVDSATASATLDFGARFERERSWFAPSVRVGYRNDIINDGVITTGRFLNGATPFSIESEAFPSSGFLLGLTFASGSKYSSFSFNYDADIRDGFNRHTARLVLRLLF